jgi:diguanylate cyclase (GGDEF)-like protein/PAS domain S-box-containing protein
MTRITNTIKYTVILWLGLLLVPLGYYIHLSQESHRLQISHLGEQASLFLSNIDNKAIQLHNQIQQTVEQLGHSDLLRDYAKKNSPQYKAYLIQQWQLAASNNTFLDQIRFLNQNGLEKIRIDNTLNRAHPYAVPDDQLQDKSNRDYFHYAQQLAAGEQGYFGIDLEFEHEKPVIPYKPGFRLIYPIDDDQRRLGYFIANLNVLGIISDMTTNSQYYPVDFVDINGFYALSNRTKQLFGQLIEERSIHNVPNDNPELWDTIKRAGLNEGHFYKNDNFYAFKPLHTPLFEQQISLTLVVTVPKEKILSTFAARDNEIRNEALVLLLAMGVLATFIALYWENHQRNRLDNAYNQVALDNSMAVIVTNASHQILRTNSRFCQLLGLSSENVSGKNIFDFQFSPTRKKNVIESLAINQQWQGEMILHSKETHIACLVEARSLIGNLRKVRYYVYSFSDMSEQQKTIVQLKEKTERDPTTSLWNKVKFQHTLHHFSRLADRYPNHPQSCIAIVDLDDFKRINDSYGHSAGDQVILQLSAQLLSTLRDTDFIARIGGDEFAVILQHTDPHATLQLMNRVCQAVREWTEYNVTISVGIAPVSGSAHQTFIDADNALYRSKRKGKDCVSAHGIESFSIVKN